MLRPIIIIIIVMIFFFFCFLLFFTLLVCLHYNIKVSRESLLESKKMEKHHYSFYFILKAIPIDPGRLNFLWKLEKKSYLYEWPWTKCYPAILVMAMLFLPSTSGCNISNWGRLWTLKQSIIILKSKIITWFICKHEIIFVKLGFSSSANNLELTSTTH